MLTFFRKFLKSATALLPLLILSVGYAGQSTLLQVHATEHRIEARFQTGSENQKSISTTACEICDLAQLTPLLNSATPIPSITPLLSELAAIRPDSIVHSDISGPQAARAPPLFYLI
jgi:hypothetical protein